MRAEHRMLWRVMLFSVLAVCLLPVALWGEDASKDVLAPQTFVLTTHDHLLSLRGPGGLAHRHSRSDRTGAGYRSSNAYPGGRDHHGHL